MFIVFIVLECIVPYNVNSTCASGNPKNNRDYDWWSYSCWWWLRSLLIASQNSLITRNISAKTQLTHNIHSGPPRPSDTPTCIGIISTLNGPHACAAHQTDFLGYANLSSTLTNVAQECHHSIHPSIRYMSQRT